MSGLVKAKKYDWKDSNLSMFGSDTEKEVKKESAESEPAWQGVGEEEGLKIWRIVNFEVTEWPEADYGKFFSGDSYIVLNTYKADPDSEKLDFDVHFWIGGRSSQDEYGTVAYKTVELDTFLDDAAVQHREVQGHESTLFQTYFKSITIMEGGAESGFRHVEPEEYYPRLLQVSGANRAVTVKQVPLNRDRVTEKDIFILDLGMKIYQWNGSECSPMEKAKAMQYVQEMESERGGAATEVLDSADTPESHEFFEKLSEDDEDDDDEVEEAGAKALYKIADGSDPEKIKEDDVSIDDFSSGDVYVLDCGDECFVWIGADASTNEKKNGLGYATKVLSGSGHSLAPISVIKEGQCSKAFNVAIGA